MASRRTRKTTRTTHTSYSASGWMFRLAFWLVVIIGAVMATVGIMHAAGISWAWFEGFCNYVRHACFAVGMFIPVVMSYQVARRKGTGWFVAWIIFVALVIVGIITMCF